MMALTLPRYSASNLSAFDTISLLIGPDSDMARGKKSREAFEAEQRNLDEKQVIMAEHLKIPVENIAAKDAGGPFEAMNISTLPGKLTMLVVSGLNLAIITAEYLAQRKHTTKRLDVLKENLLEAQKDERPFAKLLALDIKELEYQITKLKGWKGYSKLAIDMMAKGIFAGVGSGVLVNALVKLYNRRRINHALNQQAQQNPRST